MKPTQIISRTVLLLSYLAVAASVLFYFVGLPKTGQRVFFMDDSSPFWGLFFLTLGHFALILISQFATVGWKVWKGDERLYANSLLIFLVSAFMLNRFVPVYGPFVDWVNVWVIGMNITLLLFPYRKKLPRSLAAILYVMGGFSLVLSFYMSVFMGPLLALCIPMALFLGVSLHSLVPLFYFLYFIRTGLQTRSDPLFRTAYWGGVMIPLAVFLVFTVRWQMVQKKVEKIREAYHGEFQPDVPEWVWLSQHLPNDFLTQKVITAKAFSQDLWWLDKDDWLNEIGTSIVKRNDPLSVAASGLYGFMEFDNETLLLLLESRYDARHLTHRRLWSGDHLKTKSVSTRLRIFPDYRIAYMEKELSIRNLSPEDSRQEEAIYTFHLPEGSVVTSLSLWINGVEEKSRLTTKSKADKAYTTIVGVERRDPALLHWQEGNRVSVTVFPCTPEEDRRFKVGFTIPLQFDGHRLTLGNVWFDGPAPAGAKEKMELQFEGGKPAGLKLPFSMRKKEGDLMTHSGKYRPDWELSFEAPPLSESEFTFDGSTYSVSGLVPQNYPFRPQTVILDVNSSWSPWHMEKVWQSVKDLEVFVFTPQKVQLTEDNYQKIYHQLSKQQFSMLPFHRIGNPAATLVISRSSSRSPLLQDLDKSAFASSLKSYMMNLNGKVRLYNIGSTLSPYLSTLREFRLLEYAEGDMEGLQTMIQNGHFRDMNEDANHIALFGAGLMVERKTTGVQETSLAQAPDHLMRLFEYNDLLRQIGRKYFDREALEDQWVRQAERAYTVSPVSSLITLETKQDYERFGIDENVNTLGNAAIPSDSSGSVPEPHEWVLILLVGLLIFWQLKRRIF